MGRWLILKAEDNIKTVSREGRRKMADAESRRQHLNSHLVSHTHTHKQNKQGGGDQKGQLYTAVCKNFFFKEKQQTLK